MFRDPRQISSVSTYTQRAACVILLSFVSTADVRPACETDCFTGAKDYNTGAGNDWRTDNTVCISNADTGTLQSNGCGDWKKSGLPVCSGHVPRNRTKMINAVECCLGDITGTRGENADGRGTETEEVENSILFEDKCTPSS